MERDQSQANNDTSESSDRKMSSKLKTASTSIGYDYDVPLTDDDKEKFKQTFLRKESARSSIKLVKSPASNFKIQRS